MGKNDNRKGLVKVVREGVRSKSKREWIGRTEGDKIRFGKIECFDEVKGELVLKKLIKAAVLAEWNIDKLKYDKLKITVIKEWDR